MKVPGRRAGLSKGELTGVRVSLVLSPAICQPPQPGEDCYVALMLQKRINGSCFVVRAMQSQNPATGEAEGADGAGAHVAIRLPGNLTASACSTFLRLKGSASRYPARRGRTHMPRLMAVSLTEPQVRDRTKTVTRRMGWRMLRVGDRITLCRKVMGRCRGEPRQLAVTIEPRERISALRLRSSTGWLRTSQRCAPSALPGPDYRDPQRGLLHALQRLLRLPHPPPPCLVRGACAADYRQPGRGGFPAAVSAWGTA